MTEEQLRLILQAAQAASTSSNIQAYSVIGVRNEGTKRALAEAAGGQAHVAECPLFLVWCADLHRLQTAVRRHEAVDLEQNVETFLLGTIDATLAAQNAAVALESLGLGFVYVGGLRNDPRRVTELLGLPPLVYPLFGMSIGVPDQRPDLRPRLPLEAVYHRETYSDRAFGDAIDRYDETTRTYYARRTGGWKETFWSKEMHERFRGGRLREHLREYLERQGFRFR